MFNYTSRIPIEDILEQTREIQLQESEKEENKIVSPYTMKRKKKNNFKSIIVYSIGVIVLVLLILLFIKFLIDKQNKKIGSNFVNERRNVL